MTGPPYGLVHDEQEEKKGDKMEVKVIFTYDETAGRWKVSVGGAKDETEAKQAFNAVIVSAREVFVTLEHKTNVSAVGFIDITPAV